MDESETKLTRSQYRAIEQYVEHGRAAPAAAVLGIALQTMKNRLAEARRVTRSRTTIQMIYRLGTGELDHLIPEDGDPQ